MSDPPPDTKFRASVVAALQAPVIFVLAGLVAFFVAGLPTAALIAALGVAVYALAYRYRADPPTTDTVIPTDWACPFCRNAFLVKGGTHWWCEACAVYFVVGQGDDAFSMSCYECNCGAVMRHVTDRWLEFFPPYVFRHQFRLECHRCGSEPGVRHVYDAPSGRRPARYYLDYLEMTVRSSELPETLPDTEQARLQERWERTNRGRRPWFATVVFWLLIALLLASVLLGLSRAL